MKKILLINNYDMSQARELYVKGNSPSHHLFGTNELIDSGKYTVDYMLVSPKNYHNKILKLLSLIPVWIKAYRKSLKYDFVYGAADFTVDFLGITKKLGLFKPKLIGIFHHPPFEQRLSVEKFDSILFLSKPAYEEMRNIFPSRIKEMHFIQWGPDLKFYTKIAQTLNYEKTHEEVVFISNGKTRRDHEILVSAAEDTKSKTIIVSDKYNLPQNFNNESNYVEIYHQEKPDDTTMVQLLNQCSVLVIPTPKGPKRYGPIGLTSFIDAVALGMPMITAHNTVFAEIVSEHNMGLVYEAGNLDNLEKCMQYFSTYPGNIHSMGYNAYQFGKENDIIKFGTQLVQILV